jgi:hexosaminidase
MTMMAAAVLCAGGAAATDLVVVPAPREMVRREGSYTVKAAAVDRSLTTFVADPSLAPEGYRLVVSATGIVVRAVGEAGRFYAEQTLRQLAVPENGRLTFPAVEIDDAPAFRWRGALLDEGRHFFGKETVKQMLDLMAYHKFNVLHWHLTEDQGWRIDVPGLPELVQFGAWRKESPKHGARLKHLGKFRYQIDGNGQKYGPFYYTPADLREIVAYAAERQIRIVPEVDLPGHMRSAIAAYPNLTCFPEKIVERSAHCQWGISTDVLCLGNDETVAFLERVFDFLCDVFPSEVIHIGGDECPRLNWEKCPKCRARMEKEGFTSAGQLQGWITRKMAAHLARRGRRIMGWDEILADDPPKTAIGQSWRTQGGNGAGTTLVAGAEAARLGFDMVMTPHTETYYDYRQGLKDDPFQYPGGNIPLARAYAFDPCAGVVPEARGHVLGSQAQMWSEYIWNEYDLAWKMWPRACAMAEVLWTPAEKKNFDDFLRRMRVHRRRLVGMGVNCAPLE